MARRSRSQRSGPSGIWLFLLGLLVGGGALWLVFQDRSPSQRPQEAPDATTPAQRPLPAHSPQGADRVVVPSIPQEAPDTEIPSGVAIEPSTRPGHVALVIDDLGRTTEDLRPLAALGVPVTYAVLPYSEETPAVVAELRREGKEILLHLPMEPKNGENPGPGALRLQMTPQELADGTEAALRQVPGAVGVNNHMGSILSADEPSMRAILHVLAGHGLFYLDSRTSADSVGYRTALAMGIPAAERQVFLDRDPTPEAIAAQFQRLLPLSRTRGAAVAIGHPHPQTLAVLQAEVPKARALGYEFVPVSFLLDREGEPE